MSEPQEEQGLWLVEGNLCEEKAAINKVLRNLWQLNDAIGEAWGLNIDVTLTCAKHKVKVIESLTAKCTLEICDMEDYNA